MKPLENIKLGYSSLGTGGIYIYRHGKDTGLALEKRDAEADVIDVITMKMMDNSPKGSTLTYELGDKTYKLTVEPVPNNPDKEAIQITGDPNDTMVTFKLEGNRLIEDTKPR